MSNINLFDGTSWISAGGVNEVNELNVDWLLTNSSSVIVPATGGHYLITANNDQRYVFVILPHQPTNGIIVGLQVIDNSNNFVYLQPTGSDRIDQTSTLTLFKSQGQLIEQVRYYNGRWLRLEGAYVYTNPPILEPYKFSTVEAIKTDRVLLFSTLLFQSAPQLVSQVPTLIVQRTSVLVEIRPLTLMVYT